MSLRKAAIIAAGLALAGVPAGTYAAKPQQPPQQTSQAQSTASQGTQQESVAEAARKAREKAKTEPANIKTFTNDDISSLRTVGVSLVGSTQTTPAPQPASAQTNPAATAEPKKDEAYWRKRFAEARAKLATAQKEIDVMQRELNTMATQYYPDPNEALKQQYTREDINDKTAKIEAKKQEVVQLQQALDDLTDELRRSGAPAGWGS